MGDGPQAANLPNVPVPLGSPEVARAARPVDWFAIVTQGNLQKFMPGFTASLDDRRRWDVVAYLYTLSTNSDELAQGRQVYEQQCQACHGPSGRGDGPDAPPNTNDWSDPSLLAQASGEQIRAVVASGTQNGMPGFGNQLNETQLWAVTAYTRSLSFAAAPSGQQAQAATPQSGTPAATEGTLAPAGTPAPEGTVAADKVTVNGRVNNVSGSPLPAGLQVTLLGFDSMQRALELNGEVQPDGSFAFVDVDLPPERVFMATVEYNGYTFNSDILHARDAQPGGENRLDVQVYDWSSDASALTADRMHIFFDFSKPDLVQVGELFIISNPTQNLIVPAKPGEPVLKFSLPPGATNLNFQDGALGQRFVQLENGFGDTQVVPPGVGQHQVLFAYELPYDRKLDLSLAVPLPVASAMIIGPSGNVRISSDQLTDAGVRTMQDTSVHLYTAENLAAGSTLDVSLSGRPGGGFWQNNNLTSILVGAGALLLALAVAGLWMMRRRRAEYAYAEAGEEDEAPVENGSRESLLDAIVALDDLYQSGQIPQEAYEKRRAELKQQLREYEQGGKPA
jgi:mono/diheme cytochrome c family protein